ncbi:MAG: amidohydrolase [Anaerolineae bacterium]
MVNDFMAQAQSLRDELIARRRDFHRHPELAFEEHRTAAIVAQTLTELGLEVQTGIGKTGVVGILEGSQDGITVLVRADMDALPIFEANTVEYASQTAGKMHACGHDGHTAIALAVAKMLSARRDQIKGRIKFVFQPAEEIAGGAAAMIADGVLQSPTPQVSLGLHLWNGLPVGDVSVTEGAAMASSNVMKMTIKGRGGHGAIPEQTIDPLLAGAHIVSALQSIISRNKSGLDTATLSMCKFQSGTTHNVIPDEAVLEGTFRTYSHAMNELITRRVKEIAEGIAAAMGCKIEVQIQYQTPPLINDSEVNQRVRAAFKQVTVPKPLRLIDNERTMGSEDMALFTDAVPGTFFFVGSASQTHETYPHHHPRFDIDEACLPIAAGLLATAVAEYVLE